MRSFVAAFLTLSGAVFGVAWRSATPSAIPEGTSTIGGRRYGVGSNSLLLIRTSSALKGIRITP
jgi:hypothetical protein